MMLGLNGSSLQRLAKSPAARLFALFFIIYCVTAPGGYEVADAGVRYDTAKSWIEGRGGALNSPVAHDSAAVGAVAPDGSVYTVYGPLQSVLMVPVCLLARVLSHGSPDVAAKLIFGILVIPLLSALSMAVLFRALADLGYSPRSALWTVLVIGLATPLWHYGRSGQEENIVGLGLALYLLGMAWIFRQRYSGLVVVALAVSAMVATRWSSVPTVGVILIPVAIHLWSPRRNAREWMNSLCMALVLGAATLVSLMLYNYARYKAPLETGYGLYFKQHHLDFFVPSHAPAAAMALLFSPYRGFLLFCPVIVILLGLRHARPPQSIHQLWPFIVAACALNLCFVSTYTAWDGAFAWGPRFLVAPIVLIAPLFASVFASGQRWWPIVIFSSIVQLCSTVLPSAAENFVYAMRNDSTAGSCSPWTCDCTATCLRLPWSAKALENTALGRPLLVVDSESGVALDPHAILASSDYNSVYWWPVRAAYRAHKLNPPLALALCLGILMGAGFASYSMYRRSAEVPEPLTS